jgi:hypothetical protein
MCVHTVARDRSDNVTRCRGDSTHRSTSAGAPARSRMGAEMGDDRQHPAVTVGVFGHAELEHDTAHVAVDGSLADDEPARDRGISEALGHQLEYLALALRQAGQLIGLAAWRQ